MTQFLTRFALILVTVGLTHGASAQPAPVMNAAEIRQALDKLEVVGSAMYIAAHPDDENTAMLSWLSSGRDVRTGYLALTRGDGGQNLIGDEIGPALGVIRTQELLAARSVDGAEQFFTRAVDFGYSKSASESLKKWGHQDVLADVVWMIRSFRPDVVITRFPPTAYAGHGHHTASAMLALEAFAAAADPARFPEQLEYVEPWQPKRLMWNAWNVEETSSLLPVDLGEYDPLLGRSYTEVAGVSRSMHKSQGFGAAERRGTLLNHLRIDAGEAAQTDPFEGIDLSWRRVEGGPELIPLIDSIQRAYSETDPSAIVPQLVQLRRGVARLTDPAAREKLEEIDSIIRSASGLWIEAIAPAANVSHGGTLEIEITTIRRGRHPVTLTGLTLLASDGSELRPRQSVKHTGIPATPDRNAPLTVAASQQIPDSLPLSEPYWLRGRDTSSTTALYDVRSHQLLGKPVGPAPFAVRFEFDVDGERISYVEPVRYRTVDRVRGEIYQLVRVVPRVSLHFSDALLIYSDTAGRPSSITLENHSNAAVEGTVTFATPEGWRVDPGSIPFALEPDQKRSFDITITPPADLTVASLGARITIDGDTSPARALQRIDYEHIPAQILMPNASVRLVRADIRTAGDRIGYIQGSGDDGPFALRQMGYDVTMLDDRAIASADLSQFDAIVVGVRAFNAREAAKANVERLHEYTRRGGTVVVQYHTADRTLSDFAPLPLQLGRGRVTIEESPVTMLLPDHPVLSRPNRITERDFENWVQERGLYFAQSWGPSWQTPLASADPSEEPLAGGLVYTPYGEGHFIYTGYSFFRQIPAGVPGALRLLANLVSIGAVNE